MWLHRISWIGVILAGLLFLAGATVHVATMLGIHMEQYIPWEWGAAWIFLAFANLGILLGNQLLRTEAERKRAPSLVVPRVVRYILWIGLLIITFYALWALFTLPGIDSTFADNHFRAVRRDSVSVMLWSLTVMLNIMQYGLRWDLFGSSDKTDPATQQTRWWNGAAFVLAGLGFISSTLIYGAMILGVPTPSYLVGLWLGAGALLLFFLSLFVTPLAPAPYPPRAPLPRWVSDLLTFLIVLLLFNIVLGLMAAALLPGSGDRVLGVAAAFFMFVYFTVARVIAQHRLGWQGLLIFPTPDSAQQAGR